MRCKRPALLLRPMRAADVAAVVTLDRLSFATPWSTSAFRHEVIGSDHSHMLILERADAPLGQSERPGWRSLRPRSDGTRFLRPLSDGTRFLQRQSRPQSAGTRSWWRGRAAPAHPAGYGGLWVIEDEGHISTLAVQPSERGQRWGELILSALMQRALTAGAEYIVLEVRVSNQVAQALYRKYDFACVGRRRRYYADTEDAYTMRLDMDEAAQAIFQERRAALWRHFAALQGLEDRYTGAPWPEVKPAAP